MYEDIKTACLYVRFSSHNQTEQSIEGQTRVCQEFCQRHNIKIVEIYADRATSASKNTERRVSFLKMIKDSEKGLFDAVVVYKLDRFARSRYDSATYKYRLKKNGVQLISATENITNNPEGIILESVLEGMAEFYSAELSQKINRGMRESAYKHNSIGGALPLGYKTVDKKLVIDEKTAPIVREAFTMYAEGHSVAEICRIFNARGYKTSKGTEFGKNSFSKIFRNERYIGTYTYHDYRAEDAIPAIIDRDLWDRVQLRLKKIKNSPGRNKAKRVYLLSGKLFCGHCGESMNGSCNGNKYAFYECYGKKSKYNGCQKRNLRKEYIERLVAQDALSLLTDKNIEHLATVACERNDYEIETGSPIPVIRDRIHQTEVSINNLTKGVGKGAPPPPFKKRGGGGGGEKKPPPPPQKKGGKGGGAKRGSSCGGGRERGGGGGREPPLSLFPHRPRGGGGKRPPPLLFSLSPKQTPPPPTGRASLLLIEVIQLGLCRLQTLRHLGEGIVDTGKISARVCTKGCPVGHLAFQQERIFLFPSGKFHGHGIAPVAADLHRIGGFDLLAGIQKGSTGVLLIGQQVSTDLHTGKAVLRVWVSCQNLQVRFKALDKALVLFNLLREVFEQLVLQTILLALVVGFHQLQAGYLHIQIHTLFDAGISGAQGFNLGKGKSRFVHIIAGTHRRFRSHDLD